MFVFFSGMAVKVLTWNVLYGFHDYSDEVRRPRLNTARLEAAKKVVAEEKPDVFVITEACFAVANSYREILDYKKEFKFPYATHGTWQDEWGNIVLSKYPIKGEVKKAGWRTMLRTEISIDDKVLHLDVIHPSPQEGDAMKIAGYHQALGMRETPYVLTGDFNALSDEDAQWYKKKDLIKAFEVFDKTPKESVERLLDVSFIPWLRKTKLIDAMPLSERKPTIPTGLISKDKLSAMRIDYFFVDEEVDVLKAKTIYNANTEKASDHYPICMTIKI